ncbi:hypothetical protein SARC_02746 [Sphaeroforma arctica JP610]|uniref:Translation initiation factor IF2/IF5 domain-containing protein n=1 Tax=Sphaeroforma arctica JP610 TaxID=667725 RepID=A0A0L0G9X4_9EUKA|nr:hypothetical protein SARC_02746 [Sphaeroforma arctica JP610]KNC85053.1 hypothetical protein SARC_02746 [Sphaeroforma arctica JP610]|eukprot:XP_014158955.1 hypothetical protein SARC_02746 [Sphaeroforma arctica JP610]
MADDTPADFFDLSTTKKKKKKKTLPNFDADTAGNTTAEGVLEGAAEAVTNAVEEVAAAVGDIDLSFGGKKKRKKKTAPADFGDFDAPKKQAEPVAEETEEVEGADLELTKKKKKKKKKDLAFLDEDEGGDALLEDDADDTKEKSIWAQDCEREYAYEDLLARVYQTMKQRNPDSAAGERKRVTVRPPQIVRIGTKRTGFVNFVEICKQVHRLPDHVMAYALSELGTTGSIDGDSKLVIKGRFQQKQIENVLRSYIREYVSCHTCRSPDTILTKDNRLFFLQCESCGAQCSVATIHSGFQAITTKRAKIRAAQ